MTRLALAAYGCGFTSALLLVTWVGNRGCLAVGIAGGIGYAVGVGLAAIWLVRWIGLKMGWLTVLHVEHSQPLDQPKDSSPY